ncbi:uncharacterized protein LOC127874812 [Dreissena polymorpha]|uniref:Uncharacterized protein n=1 Tax=Dreissena polymorpha TaxID=45954 RepID=A0A9D4QYK6_DREPO|nr:uncharacterized protein LOC127874812 [Dreissena polymorpha]KAH3847633.1 hypothetical protein DPMN_089961 [Dreissena polymorpha]
MDSKSYLLVVLAAVAVVVGVVDSASINKRAVGLQEPCFAVSTSGPVSPANFAETITDLKLRAQALHVMSLDIKTWLKTPSTPGANPIVANSTAVFLDTYHFTSDPSLNGSVADAAANPIGALQTHFKLLREIAEYIAATRKSDKLVNDASMGILVSNLESLENRVLSAACSVQIALRAKGSDVTSFEPKLVQLYSNVPEPVWRVYIVMNDSARLSHPYLTTVYEKLSAVTA